MQAIQASSDNATGSGTELEIQINVAELGSLSEDTTTTGTTAATNPPAKKVYRRENTYHRKQQNRIASQALRQRRQQRLVDLETQLQQLTTMQGGGNLENESLKQRILQLQVENMNFRQLLGL
ncbi:hypothetical protein BDR26DRAFT_926393 [Obelidium mucronatum]|nr:hypothetical protein BDR26DRAFT_926393 [Obelidium mucronatum]